MGRQVFLWTVVTVALVCALAVSGVFFLTVLRGAAPPQAATPETEAAAETTSPPPTQAQTPPDWRLLLVNPWNPLPKDYQVELADLGDDFFIDRRVEPALTQMLDTARQEGMDLLVRSAFRTRETQQALYDNKIKRLIAQGWSAEEAPQEAAKWVARPGTSEHEAGLALDIVAADFTNLTAAQADTPQQQWLMANAHRFGFILRYPEEKQSITGIGYEPWHYRYVGPEAAERMYRDKLCLEEYLDTLPSPAP